MALLECKHLVKVYPGGKQAVRDVSFHVDKGEIVALLGPNGAGKSTTFSMSVGLIAPTEGQVLLDGRDVTHWAMYRRARAGMGYLPQYHSIFVKLTVEQNLQAILEFLPLSYDERMERINRLIDQFGLEDQRHQVSSTLSGGQKRRLEIARCLATDPAIVLLDEPFTGIDPKTINDIQDIIIHLRDSGISILLTDHRERETLTIVDRTYVICDGEVVVGGDAATVLSHKRAQELYFGSRFDATSILEQKSNLRAERQETKAA